MSTQLVLELELRESYTLDNFIAGDNTLLIKMLEQMMRPSGERQILIWGGNYTGKSHLLQALCQRFSEKKIASSYFPLQQFIEHSPDILDGFENINLVCIDDVQMLQNQPIWQEKIFNLINLMRDAGNRLLFSSSLPANELNLQLEDLRSRLNWGPVIQLEYLNDENKKRALRLRASIKGFELSDQVASYMLTNYSRDMAALFEKLEHLDHASLQQKRRLTIPFVKQVFEKT